MKHEADGMGDLVTVNRIASMLDAITSDGDLKVVVREVHKRASKLQAIRAAGFQQGDRVCWRTKGKTIYGIVEGIGGSNVMVKLDHGFLARISPRDLSLLPRDKRLSA
jgi:hypothetical protein